MKRSKAQPAVVADLLAGYVPGDASSLEKVEASLRSNLKLFYLTMNRAQEEFVRSKNKFGRMPKTRLFEAGNQCLTGSTKVETYFGEMSVRDLYAWGKPFSVYSWNGKATVVAEAQPVFSKGPAECYRITRADGRWIETSADHLLLCDGGIYRTVAALASLFRSESPRTSASSVPQPTASRDPQGSTAGRDLKVHVSGALHLSQRASGFLDRCFPGSRLCDERLLRGEESGQFSFPSQGDAQQRTAFQTPDEDGREHRRTNTPFAWFDLPSSRDAAPHLWVRFSRWISRVCEQVSQSFLGEHLSPLRLSTAEGVPPRSCGESSLHPSRSSNGASSSRPPEYGNPIVSITPIATQEVFDFHVPIFNNYYAGGLVNHNCGKTTIGVAEDVAHAMGFRPWLKKEDPDYRIKVKIPNTGMVGCEVAGQTLTQRMEPQFLDFIPSYCGAEITRYSDGSMKSLTLARDYNGNPCGSSIHFRSYVQPAESYEGLLADWIHWDEPPPRAILNAAERGKMATNAPSWFTMTPLKEPYIYDLFSLHAFNTGGDDQEIAAFRGSVWDNCQDWCRECGVEVPENDPEKLSAGQMRPINRCPNCGKVMGFMPRAGIANYLKKITDPDEREAREEGKWKHLSGLVYKELDRDVHVYKDFEIPRDWMRIEIVDPHDARPTRWLFGAVSPEDIVINGKPANRIYFYTYLLPSGNIHAIVKAVQVKRAEHNYREPEMVILDAKFGSKSVKTLEDETSWEDELEKAGIKRIVLSHSAPGDIGLGHKRVKEYLGMHYSIVKGKDAPGMMFAEVGCKGDRGPLQDMFNYMWQEGKDKPEEAYKDFCDTVRYAALEQPVYRQPRPEIDTKLAELILAKQQKNGHSEKRLYHGLNIKS